jgi:hypothetical protein
MKINEIIVEGWFSPSKEEIEARDAKNKAAREPVEKEKKYFAHLAINGARTGQEKDDWERLWPKYGSGPERMSHVDREKYERMYRQDRKDEADLRRGNALDNSEKMNAWRAKYSNPPANIKPPSTTSSKPSGNDDNTEFDRLVKKLANKEKMTDAERSKFLELFDKGFGQ